MSVRVAIITSNYWPERTGIGQVTTEFGEFLAAEGIYVAVATAMPYYPEWTIHPRYRGKLWNSETHNKVRILRAAHYATTSPSAIGRILHEITLCILSVPNMFRVLRGAKTAFVVSPDLSHAFIGCMVSRAMGVPVTLVVQDVMPDAAVEMGMLTNKLVIAASRLLARANYAMADTIYTLSDGMKSRIARVGVAATKIHIVPNTIDRDELAPGLNQGREFRNRFVRDGAFTVVHSGNMGEKQDLPLLLRTAKRLVTIPEIHFLVFGDGAAKAEFLHLKETWNLTNVSHYPLQERPMLPHMLFGADVCLVSQVSEVVDFVVPSKLITSMGAGAMIIVACSPNSEPAKIIKESEGGIVVNAGDDETLARKLLDILAGRYDTGQARERARAYASVHFDRATIYGAISKLLLTGDKPA